MNKFKKYCPNVWIAECDEEHGKGDIISMETKYGKEVECEVHNLLGNKDGLFFYSVVRIEEKNYAERKAERYQNSASNHSGKSNQYYQAAQEASEFLSLGEPIKIGHHSEKRHRALYERNAKRMDKSMESYRKSEEAKHKAEYWENKANEINLSMPDSLEFYKYKLEKAKEYQTGLKNGTIEKAHSYSLVYATKDVKELNQKLETAQKLWG